MRFGENMKAILIDEDKSLHWQEVPNPVDVAIDCVGGECVGRSNL